MSARVPPGFFETIFKFSGPGQSGELQTAIGWDGGDPLDPAYRTSVAGGIGPEITEQLSSSVSLIAIDFRIGSDGPDDLVVTEVTTEAGDQGPAMLPLNSSFLATKSTALGGRRNRGRMYIPGVPEESVENDGTLDAAAVSGWNTNLQTMIDDMASITPAATPVLFHETAPFTPTPIASLPIVGLVATQRRRIRG